MNDNKYNGWANYATWRVNLEIFDGIDLADYGWQKFDDYDLAMALKDYADEIIDQSPDGLAKDYARAFLADVNWRELADHYLSDYENDKRDEDQIEEEI